MSRLIEFYHLNDNLLFEQSCFKKAYILQVNFIFIEVNHIKNLKYFLYKSNMFEALKKTLHNEIKIFWHKSKIEICAVVHFRGKRCSRQNCWTKQKNSCITC